MSTIPPGRLLLLPADNLKGLVGQQASYYTNLQSNLGGSSGTKVGVTGTLGGGRLHIVSGLSWAYNAFYWTVCPHTFPHIPTP